MKYAQHFAVVQCSNHDVTYREIICRKYVGTLSMSLKCRFHHYRVCISTHLWCENRHFSDSDIVSTSIRLIVSRWAVDRVSFVLDPKPDPPPAQSALCEYQSNELRQQNVFLPPSVKGRLLFGLLARWKNAKTALRETYS